MGNGNKWQQCDKEQWGRIGNSVRVVAEIVKWYNTWQRTWVSSKCTLNNQGKSLKKRFKKCKNARGILKVHC